MAEASTGGRPATGSTSTGSAGADQRSAATSMATGRGRPDTTASIDRLDLRAGQRRIDDELDVLGELRQDRRLVGELVEHAPPATLRP